MRSEVVRARLTRILNSGRHVRPPTVYEALGALEWLAAMVNAQEAEPAQADAERAESAPAEAAARKAAARENLARILMGWLPLRSASSLMARDLPLELLAHSLAALIHQNTPPPPEVLEMDEDAMTEGQKAEADYYRDRPDADWRGLISEASHYFSMPLPAVYDMPWPMFLWHLPHTARVRAQAKLDYLEAKSLPNIKEKRDRVYAERALKEVAGIPLEADEKPITGSDQEKYEEQKRRFKKMLGGMHSADT